MILRGSGGECGQGISSDLGFGAGDAVDAAAGQDFEAEVAPAFGSFVGLFGQDCADEPDDGCSGWEVPDCVGVNRPGSGGGSESPKG